MSMQLADDGTLDTVIRCSDCGEEFRFNFDPTDASDAGEGAYAEFVEWARGEAATDHECDPFHGGELVRTEVFEPYASVTQPKFRLELFSGPWGRFATGQEKMGYRLTQIHGDGSETVLFAAKDFGRSPSFSEDCAATVEQVMGFLCLRPGDTDADYFKDYTSEQTAFAREHAEWLSVEVQARFCDENGNVRADAE